MQEQQDRARRGGRVTDDPAAQGVRTASEPKKSPRTPARRRRWPWVLLGVLVVLALVVIFSPTLFGGWLLARYGPGLGVSAQRVSGPIWSPRLEGVTVTQPGVDAQVGAAGITVEAFNPFSKTLRLGAGIRDTTVNLNAAELIRSLENADRGRVGSGWKVSLGDLSVQNTRLSVDGKKGEIPGAQLQIKPRQDGGLSVTGRTPQGELNAEVTLGENNVITAELNADARVLNFYWPGVTAGRITGKYVLNDGPVRGDLRISDAAVRVPEARFVTVTGVGGTVTQRGATIDLKLGGQGWNGPVTATGKADLKAKNWTVTADAAPTVSGLARALGTTGEGALNLRVTAGGWQDVQVSAQAGGAGKLAGIAFSGAQASYAFTHAAGEKAPQNNDLTFSADTRLGDSLQKLSGTWTLGRSGEAELVGAFGQKPLNVQASIDAQNLITLSGQGLGGPLSGTFALKGERLNAVLNPTYGAAGARVALKGTPSDLRAVITGGTAGPFALAGTARLNKQGLKADLGPVQLDLDPKFRGKWSARNLRGAGLTLSGAGQLDLEAGDVTGNLTAQVPGLVRTLSGPLDVNYLRQRGSFTSGQQVLRWNGDSFPVTARNLEIMGGLKVSGDVTVTNTLKAFGTLTARGGGFDLTATGRGSRASLSGTVNAGAANGVTVLADTSLSAPYDTTARIQGADIGGNLSLTDTGGIRFDLTTAGQTARGVIDGQDVNASGRVNLAALRPLVNLPDLSGTLDLKLAGRGGTAAVNASVAGADVAGTLKRADGALTAALKADYAGATARVSGQVYPQVGVSGTVSARTATGQRQTLNAAVNGPYNALRARVTGRSGELSFSGVTLPAQAVDLTGTLTPKLAVSGTWGDLNVTYDGATGLARVTGAQPLTAFGQEGRVQGRATWGPGPNNTFRGAVDARGQLDQYTVALSGPWSDLNVLLTDREGLSARGTASLPEGRYDVDVRGPIAGGLFVEGNVTGRGSEPRGRINVRDAGGGAATVDLRGFSDFDVQARGLTLAGQKLVGDLNARSGVLSGTLQAGPFTVNARNGRISARGEIAGQTVSATGRLTLPATVDDLKLNVSGPYFTATAGGGVADLRGTVKVKAQRFGASPLTLSVPAQSFPLTASLTGTRATVGGLTYAGGQWSGSLQAKYALSGTPGTVKLLGAGKTLAALPFGPLTGRVQVLPEVGGAVTASLSPVLPLLPANLRAATVPGRVTAQLTATGATLVTTGTQYLNQPLNLNARVNWKDSVTASGTLRHPWARLPFVYNGRDLSVRGATLDARALKPVLGGQLADLTGRASLDLSVPGLDFAQASGRARVNLRAAGQRAAGSVSLARGQLSADLNSNLAGLNVRVRGPLYPQADARVTLDGLSATLRGNAESTLTLQAAGQYAGRGVDVTATATGLTKGAVSVQLGGTVAGAALNLAVNQGAGSGLAAWKMAGSVSVPDLGTVLLSDAVGNVTATVGGTLADLHLDTAGSVAGVKFKAPASYREGVLRLQGATATLPQGTVRASGPVFPELKLSARATVTDLLPGNYTAQITGAYSKPDVNLQGVLREGIAGLQAQGTRLTARLLGQDWKVGLSGTKLAGTLRGHLGANALGGLANADLTVNAAFVGGTPDAPIDVRLSGTPGWNARTGWRGTLRAVGDIPGGPLDAVLDGDGALKVAALVGTGKTQARLTGSLPADLAFKPGGTLNLLAFDVGALWGRPEQLRVNGTVKVGGASWSAPEAAFAGKLADSENELTGDLGASYRAGDFSVRLNGPKVAGGGTLESGRYAASLKADTLRIARLLPRGLDVDALTFAGRVEATGTLADGPQVVGVQNLALKGQQEQAGPFSLYGNASYRWRAGGTDELKTNLSGSLRGGVLKADGQLPGGVRVTVRGLGTSFLNTPALNGGAVGADVTLRGAVGNPVLEGSVTARTAAFDALATLSGRARGPHAVARVNLLGAAGGTLYADVRDLNLHAGTVRAKLYGTLQSGGTTAKVNLNGVWPQLAGTVEATVAGLKEPLALNADGRGSYVLDGGELGGGSVKLQKGQGFIPSLSGSLNLTPLPLVGGSGQLGLAATLAGRLSAPTVAATLTSRNASAYGVTLADTTGRLGGTPSGLTGTLSQGGETVATLDGGTVKLSGLGLSAAGSTLLASGTAGLDGSADLNLSASGTLSGNLKAAYRARSLSLAGNLTGPQKLAAAVDLRADPFTGWHGGVRVTGGPSLGGSGDVLTAPAVLGVSGPLAHPLAQGTAGLLGAGARIVASQTAVQVRLVDGPGATANGAVSAAPDEKGVWRWNGAASLTRPELSLSVTPSGLLADPSVLLSVRRGEWRASGTATLKGADLRVSDGERDGSLSFRGGQLATNLPGLQLARLGIPSLNGVLTASGTLNTSTQNGQVALKVTDFTSPAEVPYLGLQLSGEASANVTLRGGRPTVAAQITLPSGTLQLSALQGEKNWTGRLSGSLKQEGGTLNLNVGLDSGGLTGLLGVRTYPVDVANQKLTVNGEVSLKGQSFGATLTARNEVGGVSVDASGGIADLLPDAPLGALALQPTGEGYSVRAVLDDLEVSNLKIAPDLSGRLSGNANLQDGGGTFVLRSEGLMVGSKTLPARLEGTLAGGSWRIRGFLGQSDFTAGLSTAGERGGEVFGQGSLRALPVGALVAAFTGAAPGEGVVTGVARFRFPLADPPSGSVSVVAERIWVSATSGPSPSGTGQATSTETLTGSGTLEYAAGELRGLNVQLTGAGTWDVRGQYTREKVDVNARFTNTTFTPVLRLIPGLSELDPSLRGSLTLSAAGTYDRPRGLLRVQNVSGSVAGLSLEIPNFTGDLPDSGAFTAGGTVLTGGALGANGKLDVTGQLTLGKLSAARVGFTGLLAPQGLGALPGSTVVLAQDGEGFTLDARSRSTNAATGAGTLRLSGPVSPRLDLTLAARNYNLPLSVIFARESALNADLRAVDDGTVIRVSGAADFLRLTLGRADAKTALPTPGKTNGQAPNGMPNGTGRTTDNYVSPLPEVYSTFPAPQADAEGAAPRPARPFLERVVFEDIPIRAPGGIRVDESLARAEFSTAGLTLSGSGARPRISGSVRSERGFIYLRENEFTLSGSSVTFAGDSLLPAFNITATGQVQAVTTRQRVPVTLNLSGEFAAREGGQVALDLTTTLSCATEGTACNDPDTGQRYTEPELYALVATGVPNLTALPGNIGALGASAVQTALNVFVLGELERTLARAFGLDVFRLTPNLNGVDGVNATLTLGSYLTRDLYLQYQVDLAGKGLLDATYSTPDDRFTFRVSTPLTGLDLGSLRPSFSAGYNISPRTNLSIGVQNADASTRVRFGVTYRIGGR